MVVLGSAVPVGSGVSLAVGEAKTGSKAVDIKVRVGRGGFVLVGGKNTVYVGVDTMVCGVAGRVVDVNVCEGCMVSEIVVTAAGVDVCGISEGDNSARRVEEGIGD